MIKFLAQCPNCGKAKKPICDHISCTCTEWDETEWYTYLAGERFIIEEFENHDE